MTVLLEMKVINSSFFLKVLLPPQVKTFLEKDLPLSLKTLGLIKLNEEGEGGTMQQLFEDSVGELTPLLKVEIDS